MTNVAPISNFQDQPERSLSRTVVLELARVTEAAARAAVKHLGKGNKNAADGAAVDAMRSMLNTMYVSGSVAIGEGEKDKAPMLYVGEPLGTEEGRKNGPELEIAVDPIDGTTIVAKGSENAISVMAIAEKGCFFRTPDLYRMQKIVVGPGMDISEFNMDMSTEEIVKIAAKQKNIAPEELVVCILERERNQKFVDAVRAAGARVKLIGDGDVAGAIATSLPQSGVDILIGYGGSPEGVIAAAALKCLGGDILGRMIYPDDKVVPSLEEAGLDPVRVYNTEELAKGEVMFAATGITDGTMLKGIYQQNGVEVTHSVVMRSKTKTVRWVESHYQSNQ